MAMNIAPLTGKCANFTVMEFEERGNFASK
jgi:hypothetical protein